MSLITGKIIESISGFYYVEAADTVYSCKAKGSFRNKKISPLVGDNVTLDVEGDKGTVVAISDRKNQLQRPPLANIDILFIVSSVISPKPNLYVIDKLSAYAYYKHIEPVIVFSKCDMEDPRQFAEIYKKTGFKTICCSAHMNLGIDEIVSCISGKICAFTGNSGVGKSSILNSINPSLGLKTNEISEKLGRGKHTTRSVHLYKIGDGYIADTPGFSAVDFDNLNERIYKDELADYFPEFLNFTDKCKFGPSCSHVADKGCAVLKAVEDGLIPEQRHESYKKMYDEIKNFKRWE